MHAHTYTNTFRGSQAVATQLRWRTGKDRGKPRARARKRIVSYVCCWEPQVCHSMSSACVVCACSFTKLLPVFVGGVVTRAMMFVTKRRRRLLCFTISRSLCLPLFVPTAFSALLRCCVRWATESPWVTIESITVSANVCRALVLCLYTYTVSCQAQLYIYPKLISRTLLTSTSLWWHTMSCQVPLKSDCIFHYQRDNRYWIEQCSTTASHDKKGLHHFYKSIL